MGKKLGKGGRAIAATKSLQEHYTNLGFEVQVGMIGPAKFHAPDRLQVFARGKISPHLSEWEGFPITIVEDADLAPDFV